MKNYEKFFYFISTAAVIIGGVLWLGHIDWLASANSDDIKSLKGQEVDHVKQFEEIRIRLTHIEDAVGANKDDDDKNSGM